MRTDYARNEEPKQEESIKDQPALPDLEIEADELEQEDADKVDGGFQIFPGMLG
jgi:hypothetical protein